MNETWKELGIMNKPWENEPDKKVFEYKGFGCKVLRHDSMKFLCGYVHIPILKQAKGRMAQFQSFFIEYGLIEDDDGSNVYYQFDEIFDIRVHGGITFSRVIEENDQKFFVIGFDCGHAGDLIPSMESILRRPIFGHADPIFGSDIYRDMNYVESECKSMVDQLLEEEQA